MQMHMPALVAKLQRPVLKFALISIGLLVVIRSSILLIRGKHFPYDLERSVSLEGGVQCNELDESDYRS